MTQTRIHQAVRLKSAIDKMAARYGHSQLVKGMAVNHTKRDRAERAAVRQYRALMRLTAALADVALDGAR